MSKKISGLKTEPMSSVFGSDSGSVLFTISIPDVPPSLNKVLRMHWAKKRRLQADWEQWVYYSFEPLERVSIKRWVEARRRIRVKITLHNARQYDKDNAYGACKILFDGLKDTGLLVDDRAEFLEASVEQVKSTRKGKHTVIEIGEAA